MRENAGKTEKGSVQDRESIWGTEGRDRKHISENGKAQEADKKHKTVRRKKHAREGRNV